jgi:glycosyltransferase involved in cell wall biosynthesis
MEYIQHNMTLSGIQRVATQLLWYASEHMKGGVLPVVLDADKNTLQVYPLETLLDVLNEMESGEATRSTLDKKLIILKERVTREIPKVGGTYFIPGAFWIFQDFDFLMRWRKNGGRIYFFIHDLIQISHPEYVHAGANVMFFRTWCDVITLANGFITNSEYVAQDVRNFIETRFSNTLPSEILVRAVTLPTTLPKPMNKRRPVSDAIRRLGSRPYVLSVGTLEIRKNNLYLVKVWEELYKTSGAKPPNLIYVGKRGWDNDHFFSYIEKKGYLGDWIFIAEKIPDVDLEYLYQNCLFTAFVSFVEGWGLPIGESLGYGKLCVASNQSSMPEVGGEFAKYVNPYDWRSGIKTFSLLLSDDYERLNCENKIKVKFKAKTWHEFSSQVYDTLKEFVRIPTSKITCKIPPGVPAIVGNDDLLALEKNVKEQNIVSLRMGRMSGWSDLEDWGCWANCREATLSFYTSLQEGESVRIYMSLVLPLGRERSTISVYADGLEDQRIEISPEKEWYACDIRVKNFGIIEFSIISDGQYSDENFRITPVFGLKKICYFLLSDLSARLSFMENNYAQISRRQSVSSDSPKNNHTEIRSLEFTPINSLMIAYSAQSVLFNRIFGSDQSEISPGKIGIIKWLRHIYHLDLARKNSRRKLWHEAERHYAALIHNGSMHPKGWVQYGHMLGEQGLADAAAAAYLIAAPLLPDNDEVAMLYRRSIELFRKKMNTIQKN